jgi:lysophospholipase L1-like esterase
MEPDERFDHEIRFQPPPVLVAVVQTAYRRGGSSMRVTSCRNVGLLAGALVALAVGCGGQERVNQTEAVRASETPTYLALGDSIAYGLDPRLVPEPAFSCFSCSSLTGTVPPSSDDVFAGYPEYLQEQLNIPLENASCPGETSASFGARARTGQAAICRQFKEQDWLHARYDGTQWRYALDFLARHPRVEVVTITLGANDVLDLVATCGADPACVNEGLGGVLLTVHANVSDILSAIRNAGYAGLIVVPTYYAPSPAWTDLVRALNSYLGLAASRFDAVPVDLQALFGSDPCDAGLLIKLDPLDPGVGCDIHPSEAGARLIAAAIANAIGR